MRALFEINNNNTNNYSIAEFIVDTNLFLDWIDVLSEQEHIELPFGEVDVLSWTFLHDESLYFIRYLNTFDICWQIFNLYKEVEKNPKIIRRESKKYNNIDNYVTIDTEDIEDDIALYEEIKLIYKRDFNIEEQYIDIDKEEISIYKNLGITKKQYQEEMVLIEFIESDDYHIGYQHISYETYMANYQ